MIALYPKGGLDMDTDLQYVANGNQTYSKNTRAVTNMGQTGWAKEIVVGNIAAFQIGHLFNAQNKKVRFYVNRLTDAFVWSITFYDQNHISLGTASATTVAIDPIQDLLDALEADIVSTLGAATPSWAVNTLTIPTDADNGYVEVDLFQGYNGLIWYYVFNGTADVMQEAQSHDNTGRFHAIASRDYLGNLFIFSTTATKMPEVIDLVDVAGSGTDIVVTTTTAHGMSNGDLVLLSDTGAFTAEGNSVDGYWLITYIDDFSFSLDAQNFGTATSGRGTATIWPKGLGEIGVATYDEHANVWTYERLLRSVELNFRTFRQHSEPQVLYSNDTYNIYYTDDYNPPGVFNYVGAYFTDGAITAINAPGLYAYDFIASETRLQQNTNDAILSFAGQDQAGGALLAGRYKYTHRMLTDSLTPTPYASLSNDVVVYRPNNQGPAYNVIGSVVGETTTKLNRLTVSGIDTELFKYVELVAVYYTTQDSVEAYTVSRTLITGPTMELEHSGQESGIAFLDINELIEVDPIIETAKSNLYQDGRLLLGNVTTAAQYDLLDWTTQFEHALAKDALTGITGASSFEYVFGEYQDPITVFHQTGYMLEEMYRFGARVTYKNGLVSDWFFIDDIKFDTSATNVVTSANTPYGNRRVSGLTDNTLTNAGAGSNTPYAMYVIFSNINLDYILPDGKLLRDVVAKIEIGRVKCIPEVITTGIVLPSLNVATDFYPQNDWFTTAIVGTPGQYTQALGDGNRYIGFFISPDMVYGQVDYSFQAGDELLFYGWQDCWSIDDFKPGAGSDWLAELNGTILTPYDAAPTSHTIEGAQIVTNPWTQSGSILNTALGGLIDWHLTQPLTATNNVYYEAQLVLSMIDAIEATTTGAADYGIYMCSIYRQDVDKYGAVTDGDYFPCGHIYTVGGTSPALLGNQSVFGGDTFTQKSWVRAAWSLDSSGPTAQGQGIGYYSQNRVNVQLHYNTATAGYVYPEQVNVYGIQTWLESSTRDKTLYSNTYSTSNLVDDSEAYDATLARNYDFPGRIYYSGVRPEGSTSDSLRMFKAFWNYDVEAQYGELIDMQTVNGRLLTMQPAGLFVQYFNASGNLQVSDVAQEVIVGSAGVFPRRGTMITRYGTNHKFGIKKGTTGNGYEFLMWLNTTYKKLMKYSAGGSLAVSDVSGFRSFLAHNLDWVHDWDNPAAGLGVHMVWDARFSDMLVTVRGKRTSELWAVGEGYAIGDLVHVIPQPAGTYSTFEQTGEIYIATSSNTGAANNMPDSGEFWEDNWTKVSHDDNDYWNEYTFAYNDIKDRVTDFYTFKPVIYFNCDNAVLSPFPTELDVGDGWGQNKIYEHNKGRYAGWYETDDFSGVTYNFTTGSTTVTSAGGFLAQFPYPESFTYIVYDGNGAEYIVASVTDDTELELETASATTSNGTQYVVLQAEHGENEMVMNYQPNISKNFRAVQLTTDIRPYRMEFATAQQQSYLETGVFRFREGYWYSGIRKDSTSSGVNNANTSRLFGRWLKVKLIFQRLVYQKVFNYVVSIIENNRHP